MSDTRDFSGLRTRQSMQLDIDRLAADLAAANERAEQAEQALVDLHEGLFIGSAITRDRFEAILKAIEAAAA